MSRYTAFLPRVFALVALDTWASLVMAEQHLPQASQVLSESPQEQARAAADRLAWRQRMAVHRKPTSGCFTAKFPSETWSATQCAPPPKMPHIRPSPLKYRLSRRPATTIPSKTLNLADVGDGHDLVAVAVGGPISAVKGFFDQTMDIQTVTSVKSGTSAPGYYALQINVAPFQTPACANALAPATCRGWIQYLFMNEPSDSFALMQVWLLDFGPTCPGEGTIPQLSDMPANASWAHAGNDCIFETPTTPKLAAQSVISLRQLRLRAEATNGGQDSFTITLPDGTINGVANTRQCTETFRRMARR